MWTWRMWFFAIMPFVQASLMKNARTLGAKWAEGSIIELFRDKEAGMFLQAEGVANMSMSFGKKPQG